MKIKKLVAMLATAAMAVGLVVAAPSEAKAAKTTKMVVQLTDATDVKKVLLDIHDYGGGTSLTPSGAVTTESAVSTWGRDIYEFTKNSSKTNEWTINVEGEINLENGDWTNMQILVVKNDNSVWGGKYSMANDSNDTDNKLTNANQWNANNELYYSIDISGASWQNVAASTTDPTAAKASDVIAVIGAIGTVAYTDDCLAKIEAAETAYAAFTGNKADVTNYATLTAARAKYDQLKAAAMGEVTIYVKNADWTEAYGYVWGASELLGGWAGTKLEKDTKNPDWFVCKATIADSNNNFIFNNGNGNGQQTADLKVTSKGTYWITLTEDTLSTATLSTTAPTGWVGANTGTGTGNGGTTNNTDTADVAPVVAMVAVAALAAVVVLKKRTVSE